MEHQDTIDVLKAEILRLQKRIEDLEWGNSRTNDGIKVLYKELAAKNAELQKFNELKTQLLANVSHEYKSPLTIIKEAVAIVQDGVYGEINEMQKRFLGKAINAAERLAKLVN
ncbi:MAG: hypothetical protein KC713_08255, partial [Candidatus Omnitrophica bacterium]|nr:hypothetical protein [Candidatus Omnitrophota bacterium]